MHFILKRCRDFETAFGELVERGKGGTCNANCHSLQDMCKSSIAHRVLAGHICTQAVQFT